MLIGFLGLPRGVPGIRRAFKDLKTFRASRSSRQADTCVLCTVYDIIRTKHPPPALSDPPYLGWGVFIAM